MLYEPKFGGQAFRDTHSGPAAEPNLPGQGEVDTHNDSAGQTLHPQALPPLQPICAAPADTLLPGHQSAETQCLGAGQTKTDCGQSGHDTHHEVAAVGHEFSDEGQDARDTQVWEALVGEIVALYRRYEDLRRAQQRPLQQAMAICRTICGGDKVAGAKLYKAPTPEVALWLEPYEQQAAIVNAPIAEIEKLLVKLGKKLPVAAWADTVPGLSPRFLACIVGECGIGPGEFKSVSALWKRMGMAVINGGRQRRVTGDAATEHGYVARRRALMWKIGEQVALRHGLRNPKGEDGKPTGAIAFNDWGALYLERKAYEAARETEPGKLLTPMHAHNRAKRYVEKRLLRQLWQAWRAAA